MDRSLLTNPSFADAFHRLADVSLNPRRHTAANARAHSEAVAAHAVALARANGCSEDEMALLARLGLAHDIGKVTGSARPEHSLEVLAACGVDEPALRALVKWHDTSLPWQRAAERGQPPSDKAWRRLASEVDLRLLALFMVADRVDAPPGWRRNAPTTWFLGEARARGLVGALVLDLPDVPSEISAGGAVIRMRDGVREALVIRVRDAFELPKGGIAWDELPDDAALREIREETGATSALRCIGELAALDYVVARADGEHAKRVRYFVVERADEGDVAFERLPRGTRERRWIDVEALATLPLVNEGLRARIAAALAS